MKIITVFSLTIILGFNTIAQEKQKQNVELPDFVITGKKVVNIQKANKKEPPVLGVISRAFLQPVYSNEILKVRK